MIVFSLITSLAIAAVAAEDSGPDPSAEYGTLAAKAGRDAASQIRLALWCETRGLTRERQKHLNNAIAADPANDPARGLLGMIDDHGAWRTPNEVIERARSDANWVELRAQYRAYRDKTVDTAESHRQLATWCLDHGMSAEASVHLTAILRIDPSREDAWKDLGYRKVKGRWQRADELAVFQDELDRRRKADSKWSRILPKWKAQLGQKAKYVQAEKSLAGLTDPLAAGAVFKIFAGGSLEQQEQAVEILGKLDGIDASRALVSLAVSTSSDRVRMLAADRLAVRDPREFAAMLIGMLRDPIKYEVKPVKGPGSPGELYIQGERINTRHFYAAPASPVHFQPGDAIGFDANGLPIINRVFGYTPMPIAAALDQRMMGAPDLTGAGDALAKTSLGAAGKKLGDQMAHNQQQNAAIAMQMQGVGGVGYFMMPLVDQVPIGQYMLRAQRQAASSRVQLQADVAELERQNESTRQLNNRVSLTLKVALKENGTLDRAGWVKWYSKLTSISSAPIAPTIAERTNEKEHASSANDNPPNKDKDDQPAVLLPALTLETPVWTIDGPMPIEQIRPGDRVLTQEMATGKLEFVPVTAIRPARRGPAIRLTFGETSITSTGLQRYWCAGRGWLKANTLQPGDKVRVIDGVLRLVGSETVESAVHHHLEVAGDRGIFVGDRGLLVHDGHVAIPARNPFDSLSDSHR
jgi:hypothetical protein